ncbi:hypothetical protein Tco_0386037, partial [Tanacetum coccineum]
RNVSLLEVEETLMVDIDWINLQPIRTVRQRKDPVGKQCVFVQLAESCDEETLRIPQGTQFGGETVRLSCGHSLASNQLTQRSCDEEALRIPQGTQFGGETVRLS